MPSALSGMVGRGPRAPSHVGESQTVQLELQPCEQEHVLFSSGSLRSSLWSRPAARLEGELLAPFANKLAHLHTAIKTIGFLSHSEG